MVNFKIAGHTMGTPEYTVQEALELFHRIGLDGAEIVVQDDYRCGIPTDCGEETLAALKETAQKLGIQINPLLRLIIPDLIRWMKRFVLLRWRGFER